MNAAGNSGGYRIGVGVMRPVSVAGNFGAIAAENAREAPSLVYWLLHAFLLLFILENSFVSSLLLYHAHLVGAYQKTAFIYRKMHCFLYFQKNPSFVFMLIENMKMLELRK